MQRLALKEKPVTSTMSRTQTMQEAKGISSETFIHFSLQDSLPPGHTLVINRKLGTLSCMIVESNMAWLVGQQQFSVSEMNILLPLLESFPFYCSYELLFAHFYADEVTEEMVAHARLRLHKAMEKGTWDQEMKSVRNMLSRARLKLRLLGFDIASILETGYILKVVRLPASKEVGETG